MKPYSVQLVAWIFALATMSIHAQDAVTIDDLVRRAQIPLASISPDGGRAAYLLVRGDPIHDVYQVTVNVSDLRSSKTPTIIGEYTLIPAEAFDETEDFRPGGGDVRWISDNALIFLTKTESKMQLMSWDGRSGQLKSLTSGHDRVTIDSEDSPSQQGLSLVLTDFIDRPQIQGSPVADNSWRIRDNYRFFGSLRNPAAGRGTRTQRWSLSSDSPARLVPQGQPTEGWESEPPEWTHNAVVNAASSTSYIHDRLQSPDGYLTAAVEEGDFHLEQPGASYTSSRIVLLQADNRKAATPFARPKPTLTLLGWGPDSKSAYFVSVGARESTVNKLTLTGQVTTLYRDQGELQVPGAFYGRQGRVVNKQANSALLTRSTNVMPAELIRIDLTTGRMRVVDAPNDVFVKRRAPIVKFFDVDTAGGDAYGRLYLPLQYREGTRYPLVITQYLSRPGFYAAVGDEVPIIPLTADGIAVFAMQSRVLNQESHDGDFRMEVARVRRPLEAVQWICRKLVALGIVDQDRIGLTGLSYGAEIGMYAYWQSKIFRAMSVATGSWDPDLLAFGGQRYAAFMSQRGFPLTLDTSAIEQWREISAGLNARSDLPPLLLQSPDAEENVTVPTWFRLRRAGAPVEWYEYPNEGHVKRSPANKWWVFQRNLDWFRFWLEDEEDSSVTKTEQYQRWREMRTEWEAAKRAASAHPANERTIPENPHHS